MLRKRLLSAMVAIAVPLAAAATAQASDPIEGVWSFNGGKVAVQSVGEGTFRGVVVESTTFSECAHPVGEEIWTGLRAQPDGSYWGLHQWYVETTCAPYPEGGPTAWRILTRRDGSKSLKVCFSEPGTSQPQIPPHGKAVEANGGCSRSDWISSLPPITSADAPRFILLPETRGCLTRPKLRVKLRDPAGDPIVKAGVLLRSGMIRRRAKLIHKSNGILAVLSLRGLTKPKFRVSVSLTTALGHVLKRSRTYRLCTGKPVRKHRRS